MSNPQFSHPANPDDVHGTGWHQSMAGDGRHGNWSAQRWAVRRAQSPVQPLPDTQGPVLVPRGNAFLEGAVSGAPAYARPSLASRMIGAGIGAVVAVRAYEHLTRARRSK